MNKKFIYKLDFDALRAWRSPDANAFPILGWIDVYRASGLLDEVGPFMQARGQKICPLEHFFCTFETMQKLHNLIHESWEKFNIEITGDNLVSWKAGQPHEMRKHPKKIKAIVRNSLHHDERELCPMLDDSIEQDTIICQVIDPEDEIKDESDEMVN